MSKMRIETKGNFMNMLARGEIKKQWTTIEMYGIDTVLNVFSMGCLEDNKIGSATHSRYGVMEAFYYEGFFVEGIHVNRAYIKKNNDIVLAGEDDEIIIVENDPRCVCMYNN